MRALAAVVLLAAAAAHAQALATVHARIVDRTTGQPVAGAVIQIGNELVASDDAGELVIALPPGHYTIEVTAPWLVTKRVPLDLRADVNVTIEVEPAERASGETIEVTDTVQRAPGQFKVDAGLARALPGGGDAGKVVQSLPSVARPPAGSAEIVVWGAAPSETRVFVDGVPVPSLYHLGGYRAATGNDLIGDIQLTPAAFGPERGRAIGGIIDIAMADPKSVPRWRVQADPLDATGEAKLVLGPVALGIAVRRSWLDRAIGLVADPEQLAPNAPLPRWSDAQIVARAPVGDGIVASGWVIGSTDTLDRSLGSDDPATQTDERTQLRWLRAQLSIRRDTPSGHDAATVWFGRDHASYDLQVGLVPAARDTRAWVAGARAEQQTRIADIATLTLGLDVDGELADLSRSGSLSIPAREGDPHIFGQPPGDEVATDRWTATTLDGAGHAAIDLRTGPVIATLGARLDTWTLTASRLTPRVGTTPGIGSQQIVLDADPRGSVQLRVGDETVLRADGGRYHQARDASDTSAVFGTPALGLEQAWHVTAGGQWHRGPAQIEAVAYARWLDDLVVRELAVTPPLAKNLTQLGTGRVLGVQVTARVLGWRGVSGWLSYTLSKSTRQDAAMAAERYFDHDQTHGLIVVGGWQHGAWSVGTRARLATGEPRTPVLGAFFDARSGRFEPVRGPHNGIRLPAFFALDLRGERTLALGSGVRGTLYAEIQNLTGRANAEEIIYSADFSRTSYLTSLPLLAIAGVRIEQ